ncbi:MAG: hypothetical protein QNJ54_21430 [Prochloraceae cyanobacterium]|nr:hypothetical protein [Prochloraceae cyanobacterium]
MTDKKKYKPGMHPNSLGNLTNREGRPKYYESTKKTRTVSVTDEGWEGFEQLAKQNGCSSKSELLEKLGRGIIKLQISA